MPIKKEAQTKVNAKLIILFSESDLNNLMNGEEFRWTFTTDKGEDIDILLRPELDSDFEIEGDGFEELPEDDF
jgi:hypothetical protein